MLEACAKVSEGYWSHLRKVWQDESSCKEALRCYDMELWGRSPSRWKTQGVGNARSIGYLLREAACRKYHWHKRKAACWACGALLVLSWPQVTVCWACGALISLSSCEHHVAGVDVFSAGFSFVWVQIFPTMPWSFLWEGRFYSGIVQLWCYRSSLLTDFQKNAPHLLWTGFELLDYGMFEVVLWDGMCLRDKG